MKSFITWEQFESEKGNPQKITFGVAHLLSLMAEENNFKGLELTTGVKTSKLIKKQIKEFNLGWRYKHDVATKGFWLEQEEKE